MDAYANRFAIILGTIFFLTFFVSVHFATRSIGNASYLGVIAFLIIQASIFSMIRLIPEKSAQFEQLRTHSLRRIKVMENLSIRLLGVYLVIGLVFLPRPDGEIVVVVIGAIIIIAWIVGLLVSSKGRGLTN